MKNLIDNIKFTKTHITAYSFSYSPQDYNTTIITHEPDFKAFNRMLGLLSCWHTYNDFIPYTFRKIMSFSDNKNMLLFHGPFLVKYNDWKQYINKDS